MDGLLYAFASSIIAILRRLPLAWVARVGRIGGEIFYWIDARHRRVAMDNLKMAFGAEKTRGELRGWARENFRRIGESFACAVRTAFMSPSEVERCVEFVGGEHLRTEPGEAAPRRRVFAVGHFGNFEIFAHFGQFTSARKIATTYRGLRQPALNRLLQSVREPSGCLFFERRSGMNALKALMLEPGVYVGFLADQHGGRRGLRLPFLGRECSTNAAPAVFALRYDCPLHTAVCFRTRLGRWRLEVGEAIPTQEQGGARSVEAIMLDVNRSLENAVRRDPPNWFWVHQRWKLAPASAGKESTAQAEAEDVPV